MYDTDANPKLAGIATLTPAITGLERSLLELCGRIAGSQVGPDDDFFELGLDSLAVVELFGRVEAFLQVQIPLRVAAEYPTVRSLARWAAEYVPDDSPVRSLVRMSRHSCPVRFFCVHGIGGHVLVFGPLARRLEDAVEFYAFEAAGRSDPARGDATIQAMAARYVRDMQRVQPVGPYMLGGYSMGGVVAVEMARILRERGEEVALIAMLDSAARPPDVVGVRERSLEFVSRALGVYPPVTAPYACLEEGARELVRRVVGAERGGGITTRDVMRFADIYLVNSKAWSRYEPDAYDGDVLLFYTNAGANSPIQRAAGPDEAAEELGWGPFLDPARVRAIELPGDHWTMLNDGVEYLAGPLEQALQQWCRV